MTPKQEAFCQGIADGLNQSDAYRHAYDARNMKPETVWNNAYMLMQTSDVIARVAELQQLVTDAGTVARAWDKDRIISEAAVNVRLGRFLGQVSASNGALSAIVDVQGLRVSKVEHSGVITHALVDVSPDKLRAMAEAYELLEAKIVDADEA